MLANNLSKNIPMNITVGTTCVSLRGEVDHLVEKGSVH